MSKYYKLTAEGLEKVKALEERHQKAIAAFSDRHGLDYKKLRFSVTAGPYKPETDKVVITRKGFVSMKTKAGKEILEDWSNNVRPYIFDSRVDLLQNLGFWFNMRPSKKSTGGFCEGPILLFSVENNPQIEHNLYMELDENDSVPENLVEELNPQEFYKIYGIFKQKSDQPTVKEG